MAKRKYFWSDGVENTIGFGHTARWGTGHRHIRLAPGGQPVWRIAPRQSQLAQLAL